MPIGVLLPEILYVRGGASARHAFTDEVIYFITDAGLARDAGLAIDLDQLREPTGYQLEKAPETPSPSLFPGLNSATPLQTALQGVAKREEGSGRTTTPESGDAPQRAILAAFAKDTSKAAEAVKDLLAEEDPEKLKALSSKLIADLPTLIPDDPALAAVIAEAMAAEFGSPAAPAPSGALANEDDAEIFHLFNEDREENGRFAQKGSGDRTGGETNLQKRQRTCKEALDAYRASTDHPSVDDIVSGRIGIREALEKGFEATFGGQKVVFFTKQKIGDKYDGRGEHGRIDMIKHVLAVRSNMFPIRHHGDQIGLVERLTSKNSNQRHVVTVDRETSIAVNFMRCSDAYIRKNYK